MARNQSTLTSLSQYIPLRIAASLIGCCPVDLNMQSCKLIGDLYYKFNSKRRQRAINNIQASFPELSSNDAADLAKRSMEHMFQLFVASFEFRVLPWNTVRRQYLSKRISVFLNPIFSKQLSCHVSDDKFLRARDI